MWLCIEDLGPSAGNNKISVENGTLSWNKDRCELNFRSGRGNVNLATVPMSRMNSAQASNGRVAISGDRVVTNYAGTIDMGVSNGVTIDFRQDKAAADCLALIIGECSH